MTMIKDSEVFVDARMKQSDCVEGGASVASSWEVRAQRRLLAKAFRDTHLLPRFVLEEDGRRRKLEPGEYDPRSQLYPLSTPINELADFGKQRELILFKISNATMLHTLRLNLHFAVIFDWF
jgi:hypothetical protein